MRLLILAAFEQHIFFFGREACITAARDLVEDMVDLLLLYSLLPVIFFVGERPFRLMNLMQGFPPAYREQRPEEL